MNEISTARKLDNIKEAWNFHASNEDWRQVNPTPAELRMVVRHRIGRGWGGLVASIWFSLLMLFCTTAIVLAVRPSILVAMGWLWVESL